MKRYISFITLVAIIFTMFSAFPASAEDGVETLAASSTTTQSFFYDFNEGETVMEGWTGTEPWTVKNGMYSVELYPDSGEYNTNKLELRPFNPNGDFVFSAKIQGVCIGDTWVFYAHVGPRRAQWRVTESINYLNTTASDGDGRWTALSSTDYIGDNKWHEYKIESYNNAMFFRYYIDNKLVGEGPGYPIGEDPAGNSLYFYSSASAGTPGIVNIDWIKVETGLNKQLAFTMKEPPIMPLPSKFRTYTEGDDILLQAQVNSGVGSVSNINYKINGKTVATGNWLNSYKAYFNDAPAGKYTVVAEYNNMTSYEVYFEVLPAIDGELNVDWKTSDRLDVSLTQNKTFKNVEKVEFLVDGNVVATDRTAPYSASIGKLTPEAHTIAAVCRSTSGLALKTFYQNATPNLGNKMSVNYSNEIRYSVTGDSGSATVDLSNGTHRVLMTHKADEVTYLTLDGEETANYGAGDFIVITNGPTADVYRNGQLAFSYYLPKTTEVRKSSRNNGLTVSNMKISIPENRDNYFVKRNVTDKKAVYAVQGLGDLYYNYNIDFVAGKDDAARFVVQDGYYATDISVDNGEISCQTAIYNGNDPKTVVLGNLPDNGEDAYVRASVVAGMVTVWVDGKFVGSFRSANAIGENSFGVDVASGSIPYVSLNKHTDYYIYEDEFEGTGEFESGAYWTKTNLVEKTMDSTGKIIFETTGSGVARLSPFVDDVDLCAEMTVTRAKGKVGFEFGENTSTAIFSRIGYNFETNRYEFTDQYNEKINTASASGTFPVGKKVKLELKIRHTAEGKDVTLFVDGKAVLEQKDVRGAQRGRVGIYVEDGIVTLDSFKFAGDSKPIANARTIYDPTRVGHGASGPNYEDGSFTDAAGYTTRDGGETWVYVKRPVGGQTAGAIHATPDGDFVVAKGDCYYNEHGSRIWYTDFYNSNDPKNLEMTLVSHDAFKALETGEGMSNTGDRLRIGPSGRAFWTAATGTNEQAGHDIVLYSDDKGKTWTESETELSIRTLGSVIAESLAIELPNGVVRLYFRNNRGWIRYVDSYDGGKTFDVKNVKSTPFLSQANCFSVRYGYKTYNSYDYNTIYITWGYDNYNLDGNVQFPRTRIAMARSTDGGETWEFLGSLWEKNQENATLGAANVWMGDSRDFLYSAVDVTDNDGNLSSGGYGGVRMVLDKSAVKGTKAFETVHLLGDFYIEMLEIMPDYKSGRVLVVNKNTGNVVLQNQRISGAAVNGAISVDVAAKFAGATLGKTASGDVTFKINSDTVTFTASQLIKKNGKQYVSINDFANAYGYNVETIDGIEIISQFGGWSDGQIEAFRYAADVFVTK